MSNDNDEGRKAKMKFRQIISNIKKSVQFAGICCPRCGKKMYVDYVRCKPVCGNCGFEFRE